MSSTPLRKTSTPGIYKRGNRYVVVLRDQSGKQFKRFASTLAEARTMRTLLGADIERGELSITKRISFSEYAAEWLQTYRGRTSRGIRPNTLDGYRKAIEAEALPYFRNRPLDEFRLGDLKRFAEHLASRGLSRNTVRLYVAPVRAMLATAVEDGHLRTNPASGFRNTYGAQSTRPICKALSDEQLTRLLEEIPQPYRLLARFLAETGVRIGEAAGLLWDSVDEENHRLVIQRRYYRGTFDAPKSAYGVRTIPLSPPMANDLRTLRASVNPSSDDMVFPSPTGLPLDARALLCNVFKPAAHRIGLPWVNIHTLRHTCASRLFRAGWNAKQVQIVMGHHSPAFTLEAYVHVIPDDLPVNNVPIAGYSSQALAG